jgi:peptidoglycan hydrolase-like protein with peptidoglycan-binding domain
MANIKSIKRNQNEVNPKKVLVYALGLGLGGSAIYLAWDLLKNHHSSDSSSNDTLPSTAKGGTKSIPASTSSLKWTDSSFPLSKGLKKDYKVLNVQRAIISKGGTAAKLITDSGGADGNFGSALEKALRALGYPTTINEKLYNSLTAGNGNMGFDPVALAKQIYFAGDNYRNYTPNIDSAIQALQQIQNIKDYSAVNEQHKKFSESVSGTTSTIVTHLLLAFTKPNDKVKLNTEFTRIGLAYDAKTQKWSIPGEASKSGWSLPFFGLKGFKEVVTTQPITIRNASGKIISVKKNVILGTEISKDLKAKVTKIMTIDSKVVFAPTHFLKYV